MSQFEKDFVSVSNEDKKYLPATYNFLYSFTRKRFTKTRQYYGVTVEKYGTETYYPSPFFKPISKIVNFEELNAKNGQLSN